MDERSGGGKRGDDGSGALPSGTHAVCPRCGTAAGGNRWCAECGLNLAQQGELPTAEAYAAKIREQRWLEEQEQERRAAETDARAAATERAERAAAEVKRRRLEEEEQKRAEAVAARRERTATRRARRERRKTRLKRPAVIASTVVVGAGAAGAILLAATSGGGQRAASHRPAGAVAGTGQPGARVTDRALNTALGNALQVNFDRQVAPLNQTFEQQHGISGAFKTVVHTDQGSCTGVDGQRECTVPIEEDGVNTAAGDVMQAAVAGPIRYSVTFRSATCWTASATDFQGRLEPSGVPLPSPPNLSALGPAVTLRGCSTLTAPATRISGTGTTAAVATSPTPSVSPSTRAAVNCGATRTTTFGMVSTTVSGGAVACDVARRVVHDRFSGKAGPLENAQQGLASAYVLVDGWRCGFGTGGGGGCSRGTVSIGYQQVGTPITPTATVRSCPLFGNTGIQATANVSCIAAQGFVSDAVTSNCNTRQTCQVDGYSCHKISPIPGDVPGSFQATCISGSRKIVFGGGP